MRLPVVKVLRGMFIFPLVFPATFFRAISWPLLGIIAVSLYWASGAPDKAEHFISIPVFVINGVFIAWLAVQCHRLVLVDHEVTPSTVLRCTIQYSLALAGGLLAFLITQILLSFVVMAAVSIGSRHVPAGDRSAPDEIVAVQWLLYLTTVVPMYFLARLAPVLPRLALGHAWDFRGAWLSSRGNGWRLSLVVFVLPWLFNLAVDLVYQVSPYRLAFAMLAIFNAFLLSESIVALSLAYRELSAMPEPPPTAPPA